LIPLGGLLGALPFVFLSPFPFGPFLPCAFRLRVPCLRARPCYCRTCLPTAHVDLLGPRCLVPLFPLSSLPFFYSMSVWTGPSCFGFSLKHEWRFALFFFPYFFICLKTLGFPVSSRSPFDQVFPPWGVRHPACPLYSPLPTFFCRRSLLMSKLPMHLPCVKPGLIGLSLVGKCCHALVLPKRFLDRDVSPLDASSSFHISRAPHHVQPFLISLHCFK